MKNKQLKIWNLFIFICIIYFLGVILVYTFDEGEEVIPLLPAAGAGGNGQDPSKYLNSKSHYLPYAALTLDEVLKHILTLINKHFNLDPAYLDSNISKNLNNQLEAFMKALNLRNQKIQNALTALDLLRLTDFSGYTQPYPFTIGDSDFSALVPLLSPFLDKIYHLQKPILLKNYLVTKNDVFLNKFI